VAATIPDDVSDGDTAALLWAQRPGARRALVLGWVPPGLLRHLLAAPGLEHLDWVDPQPAATAQLAPLLAPADRAALADPRLTRRPDDLRAAARALRAAREPGSPAYDLVFVAAPPPTTVAAARLYSLDFYRDLAALMAPDAALVTSTRGAAQAARPGVLGLFASLRATLHAAFAPAPGTSSDAPPGRVAVAPGDTLWLAAGGPLARVTWDGAELARRLAQPGVSATLVDAPEPGELALRWPLDRRLALEAALDATDARLGTDALVSRDAQPVVTLYALQRRAEEVGSAAAAALGALQRGGATMVLLPWLLVLWVLLFSRPSSRASTPVPSNPATVPRLVAAFGALGMALELTLMLAFQARVGVLYQDVGALAGLFMLGLALGGAATLRAARRLGTARGAWGLALAALGAGAAAPGVLALALGALHEAPAWGWWWASGVVGALASLGVPVAQVLAQRARPDAHPGPAPPSAGAGALAARLEAADHLGGAVAAALTGAALLPVLGQGGTLAVVAAVMASLVLPTWADARRWRRQAGRVQGLGRGASWKAPWTGLWVVVAVVVGLRWGWNLQRPGPSPELSPGILADLFQTPQAGRAPGAAGPRWTRVAEPFVHYDGPRDGERASTAQTPVSAAASAAIHATARGYGGPVEVAVAVDGRGAIARVRVVASRESPAYMAGLEAFLERLRGLHPGPGADVGLRAAGAGGGGESGGIDAMTGATITSRAVLRGAVATARALDRDVLGLGLGEDEAPLREPGEPGWWRVFTAPGGAYLLIALVLALALALRWRGAGLPRGRRQATLRRARLGLLVGHAVLGGWVLNAQLSTADLARLVTWDLPGAGAGHLWVLLGVVVLTTAALGPLYCGWLCPFGAAQELLGELGGWLGWRAPLAPGLDRALRGGKYVALGVVAVVVAAGGLAGVRLVLAADPLAMGLGARAVGAGLVLVAVLAGASLFVERPWCRYACPVGAALSVGNRLRWARRWQRPRVYRRCDLGVRGPRESDCLHCDRCALGATGEAPESERADATRGIPRGRDGLAVVVAAVTVSLVAWAAAGAWEGAGEGAVAGRTATEGKARRVDMPALRRKMEQGRLSRHPALWSAPLERGDGAAR